MFHIWHELAKRGLNRREFFEEVLMEAVEFG